MRYDNCLFGHADFVISNLIREKIWKILCDSARQEKVELLFGGYGAFDHFAFMCGKDFKAFYPQTKLIFVTPYMLTTEELKEKQKQYDEMIYPPIEEVPPKFAISARNRWMSNRADIIVAYVNHAWGGAYQAYRYAIGKGKQIFQLGKIEEKDSLSVL